MILKLDDFEQGLLSQVCKFWDQGEGSWALRISMYDVK